jgi:hypothetical protein
MSEATQKREAQGRRQSPMSPSGRVEDGRGGLGLWPSPRFPSPLIKPDVPISGIRLSGWLHREARDGATRGRRWRHRTPSSR